MMSKHPGFYEEFALLLGYFLMMGNLTVSADFVLVFAVIIRPLASCNIVVKFELFELYYWLEL